MGLEIDKDLMLEIAVKRIDVPGMVKDIMDSVLEPALDKFVADTDNKYDDMLKAALLPMLKLTVQEEVEKAWAKLMAPSTAAV